MQNTKQKGSRPVATETRFNNSGDHRGPGQKFNNNKFFRMRKFFRKTY